jgi:hypothetical protein
MQAWSHRVIEEANLFNPAFCGALITQMSYDYAKKKDRGMPYSLAFLSLPIVLHRKTREALPHSTVTALLPWVQDNREQLVDFATRVRSLRDITREAVLFSAQSEFLTIDPEGLLRGGPRRKAATEKRTELFTAEARECVDRAGFLGRWFAAAGTTSTIFSAWGIAP